MLEPFANQAAAQAGRAVAIVGVGNMGGGIAVNLLKRGYQVWVNDIDTKKIDNLISNGAQVHDFTAQSAIKNVATIICVIDAEQTRSVLFGAQNLAQRLPAGHTVILCPTMAPEDVEDCAARLAQRGISTIDAPMSGGPVRAAQGCMSLMVACSEELFQRHQALLQDISNTIFYISQRPGDGARTKLVNNLLAGINLVGAAEAMVLAQNMGLDLEKTLAVIEQSSGQSWIGSDRLKRALAGDYLPRAHMGLLAKDTALALASFKSAGQHQSESIASSGPLGAVVAATFAQALQAGLDNEDDAAIFKYLQSKA